MLSIREEILDTKHLDIATSYNNIGNTYNLLGVYEKALEFQKKAMDVLEAVLDLKHRNIASSYSNIALTYSSLGIYKKALEFQEKAITIQEEIFDPKYPSLAISYNNIARIYQLLGAYEKALKFQKKAIAIFEEILDPKQPSLATSYNNISGIYQSLGAYEKALEFIKSIAIKEEILDHKHPSLATSYNNIAGTYELLKAYEKALEFQKKAIRICKEALPKDHPNQQIVFDRLIEIYTAKGLAAFKQKDYLNALADFKVSNQQKESSANWIYIGLCHYYLKEFSKAIKAYEQAASLSPEIKSQHYYNNMGTAYVKNKKFKAAKKAFQAYEKLFPNEGRAQRNWAMYYALQNENNKAIAHLQKAIDLGFGNLEWLKTDDSMDGLRKEPAFMALVEQLEKANIDNQKNK